MTRVKSDVAHYSVASYIWHVGARESCFLRPTATAIRVNAEPRRALPFARLQDAPQLVYYIGCSRRPPCTTEIQRRCCGKLRVVELRRRVELKPAKDEREWRG